MASALSLMKPNLEREKNRVIAGIASETVVEWTEDFKPTGGCVTFDGEKYSEWVRSILPSRFADLRPGRTIQLGDFLFRNRILPLTDNKYFPFSSRPCGVNRSYLELGPRRGSCSFSTQVAIPQIIDQYNDVWMSLTPMEVLTQRPGLRKAKGRVLVGGLGLGWFARRCCERAGVKSVKVCEIDRNIADAFSFDHPKLSIKVGNVWKEDPTKYDSILLDIWRDYGTAEYDPKLKEWKKVHGRIWAWGDVGDWALK